MTPLLTWEIFTGPEKRVSPIPGQHGSLPPPAGSQLSPQYISPRQHPLHQRPHAQLAGDSQRLVQQGHGLFSVAGLAPLEQGVGVVAAGPGQLGPIAGLAPSGQVAGGPS